MGINPIWRGFSLFVGSWGGQMRRVIRGGVRIIGRVIRRREGGVVCWLMIM